MTNSERSSGWGQYIPVIFSIGDLAIMNIVFWWLTLMYPFLMYSPVDARELWLSVNVAALPAVAICNFRLNTFRAIRTDTSMQFVLTEVLLHALVFLSLMAFLRIGIIPLTAYLVFYGVMALALIIFRVVGLMIIKHYRRKGFNFTRVVIIGTGATAMRLAEAMQKDQGFGYRILGFFDDDPAPHFSGKYIGPISRLAQFVAEKDVRQIYFTLSGHDANLGRVIKIADDNIAEFFYAPQLPRTLSRRVQLHAIGSMPVLSTRPNPLKNIMNRMIKRGFDLVVSSVFLCFYPLIYVPVAIAIKMSSPGPVYFKQDRTGYRGKSFKCLKFRTMKVNNTSDSAQATANDPRKTRLGDFLRRSSMDELPQFINVFKGEMSVVGPRPHMLKHTEEYAELVDRYMVRHAVKPGITGWAQVNGYRGITDELWKMEGRVEFDVWYIENWSLMLDIKIMGRTVLNALHGDKNAF